MRLNIITKIAALLILFLVTICAPRVCAEQWQVHTAFDNIPLRIIDTPRFTYFHVAQRYYQSDFASYDSPMTVMLRYDSQNPGEGIAPVAKYAPVSRTNVQLAEYSVDGEFLAMLYEDGEMDLLYDNGEVVTTRVLPSIGIPESQRVTALNVCGTQVWVSTATGYVVVDGSTGVVLNRSDLRTPVEGIGISGKTGVAIVGGVLRAFDSSIHPGRSMDFERIDIPGLPTSPKALMPLSNETFVYLADKKSGGSNSLNVVYKENGVWKYQFIRDFWIPYLTTTNRMSNAFERNCMRNKDGWVIYTEDRLIQIKDSVAPSDPAFIEMLLTSRKITMAGGWDLSKGWAYKERGEFARGVNDGTFFQIDDENAIRPEMPEMAVANYMTFSPDAGVVVCNFGHCRMLYNMALAAPGPVVSAYRNGRWSRLSQSVNVPYAAEEPGPLKTLYEDRRNYFPVNTPTGIAVDPVYQQFVWLGSSFYGFAAIDATDPKHNPVHYGAANDPLAEFPGFKALLPDCNSWPIYHPASVPSFDADGTMWVATYDFDAPGREHKDAVKLYYLTAEARGAALEAHDAALTGETGWIGLDAQNDLDSSIKCTALCHPANRNIVISYIINENRTLAILDHKGTLADKSDDELKEVYWIVDQNNVEWYVFNGNSVVEDPLTGEIWVATGQTLVAFDPKSPVIDNKIAGRSLNITSGENRGNIFENINTHCIAFDEYGRMWVTANHGGVWGISADRKDVFARYTTRNSPLPDDTTYGMVWNPDTKSLMISTAAGLAEVWPDAGGVTKMGRAPLIVPECVMPDYTGTVTIAGLKPYVDVKITDPGAATVRQLHADSTGTAVWDLRDDDGVKVESGHYVVTGDFTPVDIPVLR